jgi:hypothetical protein
MPKTQRAGNGSRTTIVGTPWMNSTKPIVAGKAKAVANGKRRQKAPKSVREIRAEVADLRDLVAGMRDACRAAAG